MKVEEPVDGTVVRKTESNIQYGPFADVGKLVRTSIPDAPTMCVIEIGKVNGNVDARLCLWYDVNNKGQTMWLPASVLFELFPSTDS